MLPTSKLGIALVGAGRVGTAVASLLRDEGHAITGVASRSESSALLGAGRLGTSIFDLHDGIPEGTDLVLLGVSDPAIGEVGRVLGARDMEGKVVTHFSGSLGIGPLAPIVQAGGKTAALHPMQACPDVDAAILRLPGSAWGITCLDSATESFATDLIKRDLHGMPVAIADADRPVWHAAAVTTSNGIAALLGAGEAILEAIGIDDPQKVLGPIAAGTVANAAEGGGGAATLTGPVVRGEDGTVRRHIETLRDRAPELLPLYRIAALLIVQSAQHSGRISSVEGDAIAEIVGR